MASFAWLAKQGDLLSTKNSVDELTTYNLNNLTTRFEDQYLEIVAVGDVTATLSAANVRKGILTSNPGGAITLTTPTAALLVAEDATRAVGRGYRFTVVNLNGVNAITLAAGSGVTLVGSATVAAGVSATYYLRYDNVTASSEAVSIVRL